MNYRKVSKKELDEYLARNPGANYRVNGQEQQGAFGDEDQGALMKILTSLSRPIRAVPGSVAAAISGDEDYDNPFLTAREEAAFKEDPTKWGTKAAAGLGSYLIPGGGGAAQSVGGKILTAAGRGAGAGAVGGFSASDDDNELENILSGAGLGALIGGGIQAGGEGLKALKNARASKGTGELGKARKYLAKQRGEALGLDPNKIAKSGRNSVSSATQADDVIDDFFSTMDELGLPTRTSNIASKSADDALGYYGSEFGKLLDQADSNMMFTADDTLSVLDEVQNVVGNNRNIMKNATVEELFNDLYSLGEVYSPSQLNAIREKARQMINWSRSSSKMPMTERGTKAVFDAIDDLFKAKIPASKPVLAKMSNIYTVRPYIQGKAQLGDVIKLGTASTNIGVPTAGINEAIQSGIGKAAQGLPSGGSNIGQAIGNIARPVAKAAQRVGPAMASQMGGQIPQQEPMGNQGMYQEQELQGELGQGGLGQDELQALNYYLVNAILQGQISSSDANAIVDLLGLESADTGGQSMPKTDSGRKAMVARDAAQQALQILERDPKAAGKLQGIENIFYDLTGQANTATEYKTQIEGLRSQVFNALGGTALSPTEKAQYEKFLPKQSDSQAQAKQKLEILIPMMEALMGVEVDTQTDEDNTNLYQQRY